MNKHKILFGLFISFLLVIGLFIAYTLIFEEIKLENNVVYNTINNTIIKNNTIITEVKYDTVADCMIKDVVHKVGEYELRCREK